MTPQIYMRAVESKSDVKSKSESRTALLFQIMSPTSTHTHTRTSTQKCIYVHIYTHVNTYSRAHVHVQRYACTHVHIYTCTHIYIHVYMYGLFAIFKLCSMHAYYLQYSISTLCPTYEWFIHDSMIHSWFNDSFICHIWMVSPIQHASIRAQTVRFYVNVQEHRALLRRKRALFQRNKARFWENGAVVQRKKNQTWWDRGFVRGYEIGSW